jgi:hypothetical protein
MGVSGLSDLAAFFGVYFSLSLVGSSATESQPVTHPLGY